MGVGNSVFAEFVMRTLMSFGSWELTVIRRFPLALGTVQQRSHIAGLAVTIYNSKARWDTGNEISSRFTLPWILQESLVSSSQSLSARLDALARFETAEQSKIQSAFSEIDAAVFELYRIPEKRQNTIRDALPDRPVEILWQQMDGRSPEQKRMEHVWRVLSFAVKRVIEGDEQGIALLLAGTGETRLADRVRQELATLFSGRDEGQLEVEIVNELKRSVKGYRKCTSLDDWLANAFFEYHASLYKNRPIFWHIASSQGTAPFAFGALVHYHRFDKNRMAKLRASYVRDAIEELRREAGLADKAGRTDDRVGASSEGRRGASARQKLQQIQEGHHEGPEGGDRDFRILTPWKEPGARPRGWASGPRRRREGEHRAARACGRAPCGAGCRMILEALVSQLEQRFQHEKRARVCLWFDERGEFARLLPLLDGSRRFAREATVRTPRLRRDTAARSDLAEAPGAPAARSGDCDGSSLASLRHLRAAARRSPRRARSERGGAPRSARRVPRDRRLLRIGGKRPTLFSFLKQAGVVAS